MIMFQPKNLQQRLTIYVLLPVSLLLISMGVAGFVYTRNKLLSEWQVAAILQLQLAAHRVDMLLSPIKNQLLSMNSNDSFSEISRVVLNWNVNCLKQMNGVEQVRLTIEDPAPPPGADPQPDFTPIRQISPPHFGHFVEDQSISLISFLLDDHHQRVGSLEVIIGYEYMIHGLTKAGWWRNSEAFLVDDTGKVLVGAASTDREKLGETGKPIEIATLAAMKAAFSGTVMGDDMPPEEVSGFYRLEQAPWTIVLIAPGKKILMAVARFQYVYIGVAAVFVFLILLLIRLVAGRAVLSIREVSLAANRVANGLYDTVLMATSGDEVGELVNSFNTMLFQLRERMRLKEAMNLAEEVQQNLLPGSFLKQDGLEIAGKIWYCEETGGDYFDFLVQTETCGRGVGIVVGDVVGHGISAALLMTTVRALLRCRLAQPGTLSHVMEDVNRLLCKDTEKSGSFMTLQCVLFDASNMKVRWVRAGHDPGLVYDPARDSFRELSGNGMALGIDSDGQYGENVLTGLEPGWILFFGTDGVWEARNVASEMFGKDRLKDMIRRHADQTAEFIVSAVLQAVREFQDSARQEDDITLVVIKVGNTEERMS